MELAGRQAAGLEAPFGRSEGGCVPCNTALAKYIRVIYEGAQFVKGRRRLLWPFVVSR